MRFLASGTRGFLVEQIAEASGLMLTGDNKIALVFPGQGSQYVGMGRPLYDQYPAAREIFREADETLGFSLSTLCFEGPATELDDTINAQPAILTVSVAALAVLKGRFEAVGAKFSPTYVAGHSLGEFTALVAAGVLDFKDALKLVRERGRLMKEAGMEIPGGMAAIVGLDRDTLAAVCLAASSEDGIVVVANDNCPGQSVISGELAALERAMTLAVTEGARRVVRLGISIASHSPLMERAGQQLNDLVARVHFHEPVIPIVTNITGQVSTSVDELRRNVGEHVVLPVQWTNSVLSMVDSGVNTFLEIGPGEVLSGLIRRVKRDVKTLSIKDIELTGTSGVTTEKSGTP
jgi:[acyl-carrier-protein] S-malonyltransferase